MNVDAKFTKRALKREQDGTPIGFPGALYLDCECGHHLSMPRVKGLPIQSYECLCGIQYNADGWVIGRTAVQS
jgi:hypothetical protein